MNCLLIKRLLFFICSQKKNKKLFVVIVKRDIEFLIKFAFEIKTGVNYL